MSRFIFILFLASPFIFLSYSSCSQSIYLHSQADVDTFDQSITIISGDLIIETTSTQNPIISLSGLSNLKYISKYLKIRYNKKLTDLTGLSGLDSIGGYVEIKHNDILTDLNALSNIKAIGGGLSIAGNYALENLDGFIGLNYINTLNIYDNDALSNVDGLSNIKTIGGRLYISTNIALKNINGFSNLQYISGSLDISNNDSLTNLNGFLNLINIGGRLSISNNDVLTNLDGFSNLQSIGGGLNISGNHKLSDINGLLNIFSIRNFLHIDYNDALSNLNGFSNLQFITGDLDISNNDNLPNLDGFSNLQSIDGYLSIFSNKILSDIDGLSNLKSVGDRLYIVGNNSLTNLDGLKNLRSVHDRFEIGNNLVLTDCCGIHDILSTPGAIGGNVFILANPSECSNKYEILKSHCGIELSILTYPPCIDIDNGSLQISILAYDTIPFYYNWENIDNGINGYGVSYSDIFYIENLSSGTYNVTVTTDTPDTAIFTGIVLSEESGSVFEIIEIKTTNSSNGISNGSISIHIAGGSAPFSYSWSGQSSGNQTGITADSFTIHNLAYGEYNIMVSDNAGKQQSVSVSLLDETVPVVPCTQPLDIVILNDVSGSVDVEEYEESKQFFVDFINAANIGIGSDESRAAIIEWSGYDKQSTRIPLTGNVATLQDYVNYHRAFNGETSPHFAMLYGKAYLDNNSRPDADKVIVLSTDAAYGQISPSLISLADKFKAAGYHLITIAFDEAYSNSYTREILREVASVDLLAPGAPAYSLLDKNLAKNIVDIYLCPIDPGSIATAYFNRDGAIDITGITMEGNCPYPYNVEITFTIEALRELSLPAGTKVTFYYNNPELAGATKILTWTMPCALAAGEIDTFNIVLPVYTSGNIFVVLNDDGSQTTPISFPITDIDERAYSNNIDNISFCTDNEATLQALKYTTTPIPVCDTIVVYTIDVCNISNVDAFDVTITDIYPSGFVLQGMVVNDNGCTTVNDSTYDIPAGCCVSLILTYDASGALYAYYSNQGVDIDGPAGQTYIDFDGSSTTAEDVIIDGRIDCPSTIIEFTKEVNVDTICDDAYIVYTFTINNEMNIPIQGLEFEDILPYPCEWIFEPYNLSGVRIGNGKLQGNQAIFTIDEVAAQTIASFSMDAALRDWDVDGVLSNYAILENVPDPDNNDFQTLISNTVKTTVKTTPEISIPDTIYAHSSDTIIDLEVILTGSGNIKWTTSGDGTFDNVNIYNPEYTFGTQDLVDKEILLFISVSTDCGEQGKSVIILLEECTLSFQDITVGDCNNNATPSDAIDDTYEVSFNISAQNPGSSGTFRVQGGNKTYGPFDYGKDQKIILPADGKTYTLLFEDIDASGCTLEREVSQNSCSDECSLTIEDITIGDCNNNATLSDATDDTYEVSFNISAQNPGSSGTFRVQDGNKTYGPFDYGKDQKIILPADGKTYTLLFEDIDVSGCTLEREVSQNSCSEKKTEIDSLYIPNIFTPDGDSYNDSWKVTVVRGKIDILSCKIFDRWGELVYSSENDNNFYWDGYFKGKKAMTGVYVYILKYLNSKNEINTVAGSFTLIR